MKPASSVTPDYTRFIAELKERIQSARIAAARAVNRELILLYWDIGRAIVEKQKWLGWGDSIVEQLARDLQAEFPRNSGFSRQNVWRMRQFFVDHTAPEFLAQLGPEMKPVPWADQFLSQLVRELGSSLPDQLQPKLPAEFRGKLPTARQLNEAVRTVLPGWQTVGL